MVEKKSEGRISETDLNYDFKPIEEKWQKKWEKEKVFEDFRGRKILK